MLQVTIKLSGEASGIVYSLEGVLKFPKGVSIVKHGKRKTILSKKYSAMRAADSRLRVPSRR